MEHKPQGMLPLELMVNHPTLDAEHDDIFCRIEAIKESSLAAETPPGDEVLALVSCFARHFATEDELARELGMEFSAHAREHAQALHLLDKACADLKSGRLDLRPFLRYLEYWFEHHINEFDKPLGRRLARPGVVRNLRAPRVGSDAGLTA